MTTIQIDILNDLTTVRNIKLLFKQLNCCQNLKLSRERVIILLSLDRLEMELNKEYCKCS